MENNLQFHETLTVEQFKIRKQVNDIVVRRKKGSNKLFFTFGGKTGAVRNDGLPTKPMMSLVTPEGVTPCFDESRIGSDKTCPTFWLLHEEGSGAEVVATF